MSPRLSYFIFLLPADDSMVSLAPVFPKKSHEEKPRGRSRSRERNDASDKSGEAKKAGAARSEFESGMKSYDEGRWFGQSNSKSD